MLTSYVSMQFLISGSSLEQTAATCHRFTQSYVWCVWSARSCARESFFSERLSWLLKKLFHISVHLKSRNAISCITLLLWQAPGTQLQPKMYLCFADSWIFWDLFQKNTSSRIICVATMILAGDWIMISWRISQSMRFLIRNSWMISLQANIRIHLAAVNFTMMTRVWVMQDFAVLPHLCAALRNMVLKEM